MCPSVALASNVVLLTDGTKAIRAACAVYFTTAVAS